MLNRPNYRSASLMTVFTAILGLGLPALAGDEVPFKGHAEAVVINAEPASDGLHLTVATVGQATHLGQFTRDESAVVHEDGTFAGTLVFVAANGDQLSADLEGAFVSPTTAVGTYTFTGGTGRFTNASGEVDFVGLTSDGIHIALTFEGTIGF